jgi:flagellar motor protein MotB
VRIEGHSDASSDRASPVGDLDSLALARAQRAARLLGLEGVPYEQMVVVSKGMRVPRGDTWSEAGQARNRRIDIVVRPLETSKR